MCVRYSTFLEHQSQDSCKVFFFFPFISFTQITCLSCIHRHRKVSAGTYHCKREGTHLNLPSSTFYDQTPRHKKGIFHSILHLLSVWPTSVLFPLFSQLFSLSRGYLQTPFQIHYLLSLTLTLRINEKLHFLANKNSYARPVFPVFPIRAECTLVKSISVPAGV